MVDGRDPEIISLGVEVIEVKLRSIHQLFHSLDPSPFYERDLDEAAERFIVGWVKDFPTGRPYHLRVHVVEPPPFGTEELGVSVRRYFAERAGQERRELRELFRRGRLSLAIGIAFLLLCTVVAELSSRWSEAGFVPRVLEEGLTIAGWVALWRPIQIFLYDWWPIRAEQRLFERLSRIEVDLVVDPR